MNSTLKTYNAFLINSLKYNKITILCFSILTTVGYFSLPYLEKYQKSVKMKIPKKNTKEDNSDKKK